MGGWGQAHEPAPSPVASTGTSRQIADAMAALRVVGVSGDNLAVTALAAAGTVDRLRHLLTRLLAATPASVGSSIHDEVRRTIDALAADAGECGLCGHVPACGYAAATLDTRQVRLCHAVSHSCYHRWTVYGDRPAAIGGAS